MKSETIKAVFIDELERNKRMILRYQKEMESLPKGSLFKRKIGGQEYFYLTFREGKKVISKFLGNAKTFDSTKISEQIERRKSLKKLIQKLNSEQKEFEKELK